MASRKKPAPFFDDAADKKAKKQLEKRQRFVRLAEPRVRKCLKSLLHVERLFNRAAYDYMPHEADKIIVAIVSAAAHLRKIVDGAKDDKEEFLLFDPVNDIAEGDAHGEAA
jgi:hypothetical protein